MKQRLAAVLALLLAAGTQPGAQSTDKSIRVFLTAAPLQKADNETQKSHDIAFATASNQRKDLENALKAQHGNKRENWPAEAQERYRRAEDVVRIAGIRRLYERADQDHVVDSVEDSRKGFTGAGMRSKRENVSLVDTPNDADLIVELRARRTEPGAGVFGRQFFVLAAIKPGPRLAPARFAAIPRDSRGVRFVPGGRPEAPELIFEAFGTGSWKVAGTDISIVVGKFIEASYDILANAAASVSEMGATAPQKPAAGPAASADPRAAPFVQVEQDGQIVTEKDGEIPLRRSPFTLVVKMPSMSVVKAHVAATPGVYELARSGRSAEMFSESGHGLAEGDRNASQDLFVAGSSPAYHLWFYDGPQDHRFDNVTVENGGVVGRRTVAQLMTAERITHKLDRYPGNTLYLTFRLEGVASRAEFRRQAMKIRFAGNPLPAAPAPPAPGSAGRIAPRRVGEGVPAPAKIKHVDAVYPAVARSARVQGFVLIDIVIAVDGSVIEATVVKSIPLLDQASLDAVKQWKFAPPRVNGRPAPVIMNALVSFALKMPD